MGNPVTSTLQVTFNNARDILIGTTLTLMLFALGLVFGGVLQFQASVTDVFMFLFVLWVLVMSSLMSVRRF